MSETKFVTVLMQIAYIAARKWHLWPQNQVTMDQWNSFSIFLMFTLYFFVSAFNLSDVNK